LLQDDLPEDEKELAKVMRNVTHICMDRPLLPGSQDKSKEYIQPQYILDSINNLFLLPTRPYLPGTPCPPHLSPFIDNEAEGYIPDRQREINTLSGVETANILAQADSESEKEDAKAKESSSEHDDDEESAEPVKPVKATNKGDADSSSSEDEVDSEVEVEAKPKKPVTRAADRQAKNEKLKRDLQKEQQELGKMMMTKRQRQAYQKAEQSQKSKQAATKKLLEKKNQIQKGKLRM
jgi:pescadillo protein